MENKKTIWLPGQPARVTHQSGTRYANHRIYKTKTLKAWEAQLSKGLALYRPAYPAEGPIRLAVAFGYKAGRKADLGKWKLTKPDTDNSIKTLKDVMTQMKFWNDDAQVVWETCKKMWVDRPGILITFEEIQADPDQIE